MYIVIWLEENEIKVNVYSKEVHALKKIDWCSSKNFDWHISYNMVKDSYED